MKNSSFKKQVYLALILAVFAAIAFQILAPIFYTSISLRLLITVLTTVYIGYLLHGSRVKTGRIVLGVLICVLLTCTWLMPWLTSTFLIVHLLLIWAVRSLYFHNTFSAALYDGVLNGMALQGALWAYTQTSSIFLVVWTFFLIQALFVLIKPFSAQDRLQPQRDSAKDEKAFEVAHTQAENALHKLFTQ